MWQNGFDDIVRTEEHMWTHVITVNSVGGYWNLEIKLEDVVRGMTLPYIDSGRFSPSLSTSGCGILQGDG